jgi:8-oxo-dGTP pyrophosphatase MutT (NUDIX family)
MTLETIIDRRTVYAGRVVALHLERVQLPGVAEPFTREIVEHRPAVAIVARDDDGQVFLVRQYRAGAHATILEVPAGVLEEDEDLLTGAQRELQEEIGYRAEHWQRLGSIYTSPGFLTEVIHLLLATGLSPARLPGDIDEDIAVERAPLAEALERVNAAEIQDAKTIVALMRAVQAAGSGQWAPGGRQRRTQSDLAP